MFYPSCLTHGLTILHVVWFGYSWLVTKNIITNLTGKKSIVQCKFYQTNFVKFRNGRCSLIHSCEFSAHFKEGILFSLCRKGCPDPRPPTTVKKIKRWNSHHLKSKFWFGFVLQLVCRVWCTCIWFLSNFYFPLLVQFLVTVGYSTWLGLGLGLRVRYSNLALYSAPKCTWTQYFGPVLNHIVLVLSLVLGSLCTRVLGARLAVLDSNTDST